MADSSMSFNFLGMRVEVKRGIIIPAVVIALALGLIAYRLINLSLVESIIGAIVGVLLYYLSSIVHHYGHHIAAKRTGHPMSHVNMWGIIGTSAYPDDEGELPPQVHVRRAIGGPIMSIIVSIVSFLVVMALNSIAGSLVWWLLVWWTISNFFIYTLGALTPLGFTDASTLLHYGRQRTS